MHRQHICIALLICLLSGGQLLAQGLNAPHANVVAYDDENAIERLAYRESPYYMELGDTWQIKQTDSSIVYSQELTVDKTWREYYAMLNIRCGKACRVYLNRKLVGMGDDSRQWNEFCLDRYLKYGKDNTIEIEALKEADGALLEDPRIEVGLNGNPYLLFKGDPYVADISVNADYDAVGQRGKLAVILKVSSESKKGRYYIEAEIKTPKGQQLDRLGKWVIFDGEYDATVELSRSWNGIEAWSAESPNLYTAIFKLYSEDMELEEITGTKFGFRRVEMKDGLLLVNNKPIMLKGVVYGLNQTESEIAREQMSRDVQTMKRHNINAVRTAGFSPVTPYFYELCDQYGLYVVCDANLKPSSTMRKAIATDAEYIPMFEQRMRNVYGTYKNHASIIAWSLGDTRDNGVCMAAAYKALKNADKQRPVIFAGAGMGTSSDIIVLTYPTRAIMESTLGKTAERAVIMARSTDETHIGDLPQLWESATRWRNFQGGFACEWPIGETALTELRDTYRAVDISIDKISIDEGSFWVVNNNSFANLSDFRLEYHIYTNIKPNIISGDLPVSATAGERCKVGMRIPPVDLVAGEELYVRFDVSSKNKGGGNDANKEKSSFIFQLPQRTKHKKAFTNNGDILTYADTSRMFAPKLRLLGHEKLVADRIMSITYFEDSTTLCRESIVRFSDQGKSMCDAHVLTTLFSTGDQTIAYSIHSAEDVRPMLIVTTTSDTLQWFGHGEMLHKVATKTDVVDFHSRTLNNPIERTDVSWCASTQGTCTTLMHLTEGKYNLHADKENLILTPNNSTKFCLHIQQCTNKQIGELISTNYPTPQTRIPPAPTINASESTIAKPIMISIQSVYPCTIRYTLDGSDPTEASPVYTQPFVLDKTTIVKAKAYCGDSTSSITVMKKFSYNFISTTTFSRKPNTPYNVGGDTLLFDRNIGSIDNLTDGWIGFSGEGVVTTLTLNKPIDVEYITLRYAHAPTTWAFAPQKVGVVVSSNGNTSGDTIMAQIPFDPSVEKNGTSQVVELKIPIQQKDITHIVINAQTIGAIPQWHRAKGLKPWLLMDEIEVSEIVSK